MAPALNPFASTWAPPGATPSSAAASPPATAESPALPKQQLPKAKSALSIQLRSNSKTQERPVVAPSNASPVTSNNPSAPASEHGAADGDSTACESGSPNSMLRGNIPTAVAAVDTCLAGLQVTGQANPSLASEQLEMEQDGPVQASASKVGLQDFELLRVVGQGAFGKVFQVRHRKTQQIYALKVMRKERIVQGNYAEYVKSERDLLTAVSHPYIVMMRFSFQTPSKLYLVLDFVNGGHLFFNLYREGLFSEDVARLYTAEIISAVSYLHANGIMHRDLKPENVLLDVQGHVRLTDFGLAKGNVHGENSRSNSFIGTMEYMAPEIIEGNGHTKSVDWWSVGILLYEMLCGQPPFRAKSRNVLQQQILTAKAKYPAFLSKDAQALLKALLTRDPAKRLGTTPSDGGPPNSGPEAIKRHPFFRTINWTRLEQRQIESKFKPGVQCSASVENFDKTWTDLAPEDSPCGTPGAHAPAHGDTFTGFTYEEPSALLKRAEQVAAAAKAPKSPSGVATH